jgi:hypothetical protein
MLEQRNEQIERKRLRGIQVMKVPVQSQPVGGLILHHLRPEGLEDIQPLQFRRQNVPVRPLHTIRKEIAALDAAESATPVFIKMRLERFFVGLQ